MPNIRYATLDDIELITRQRHQMFGDNRFSPEEFLTEMDQQFAPWLRSHLENNTYVGLLLEDDETREVVAGAGVYFMDWPPHYMHLEPMRGYLLNFYTAPETRGRGYANLLLSAAVEECRKRGAKVVTLHASPFGRPIYQKFGFETSNEMRLLL